MQECKNGGLIVAASRRTWSIARNEQWYSTDETGGGIAGAVTVPLAVRPRYASPKRASSVAIWSWDRSISRDSLRLFCIDSPNDGPFPSPTFISMLGPAVDGGPGGPGVSTAWAGQQVLHQTPKTRRKELGARYYKARYAPGLVIQSGCGLKPAAREGCGAKPNGAVSR